MVPEFLTRSKKITFSPPGNKFVKKLNLFLTVHCYVCIYAFNKHKQKTNVNNFVQKICKTTSLCVFLT